MPLPRVTELAHQLVAAHLGPGDHAVDATVGNGHDTLFLAGRVGIEGRVDGFDIQQVAIESTGSKVGGLPQVHLHRISHDELSTIVPGSVQVVMFNLGYLPGGDKHNITRPETTRLALQAALEALIPGGLITVVVYPGHAGGQSDAEAAEETIQSLDPEEYHAIRYGVATLPRSNESPYLLAVERKR